MRRVLFIAYHFPPMGGAGVQRSLKFVRYLPENGYRPIVLTGTGKSVGRWTPADEAMSSEIPDGTEIHRVPGPEPSPATGWEARAQRWMRTESAWSQWWATGIRSIPRLLLKGIDAICVSMSPFESAQPTAWLAAELRVPWVADLRDPWALDEVRTYPSRLHRRLERRQMGRALASASAVVMNTQEAAFKLRLSFPHLRQDRIFAIPNGFDAADFSSPIATREDGVFRIVHAGHLHTDSGRRSRASGIRRALGGTFGDTDLLTRSHLYLLAAARQVLEEAPYARKEIEIHLAGALTDADEQAIDLDVVRSHGYLDHASAIALMRSADLLFLPMHDVPPGRRASIVPGKTYEYLASGRAILAAVPDGDARDLLTNAGNAFLCRPADVAAIKSIIDDRLSAWRRGEADAHRADASVQARYERRRLTRDLANVLDRVTSG